MKIRIFLLLILLAFASERNKNEAENVAKSEQRIGKSSTEIFEEDKFIKENEKTSKYVGVTFYKSHSNWRAIRWSKNDHTVTYSGPYKNEETAAHASDTLARKLMENGEDGHKLNFPDDHIEVWPEEMKTSKYIGVSYNKKFERWHAQRRSKNENKVVPNGNYKDEETAAHASDTLARDFIENGEHGHKLNFPGDHTEVWPEKKKVSKYIGVSYNQERSKWYVRRRSKNENKVVPNGTYKDEETAAHASDTLAREFMENGERGHKLNFPDDHTEVWPEKMKTSSNYIGVSYNEKNGRWNAQRRRKNEKTVVPNGTYKDEETAAHGSDTLAKKLIANGEHGHKLNFPDDYQRNKRKRSSHEHLAYSPNK